MNELSLFSGAGGGLLATHHLLGWRCVGYVEMAEKPCGYLEARIKDGLLPKAPVFCMHTRDFIRQGWPEKYRGVADVITAGFPCQPFSRAGKLLGAEDDRNGWPDTITIIRVVRPRFLLLENVAALVSNPYFGTILGDLAESGYDARWDCIPASAVGANHERDRVWIVAHTNGQRPPRRNNSGNGTGRFVSGTKTESVGGGQPGSSRKMADAQGEQSRDQADGEPDTERRPGSPGGCGGIGGDETVPDTHDQRRYEVEQQNGRGTQSEGPLSETLQYGNVPHPDGEGPQGRRLQGPTPYHDWWAVEPPVGRVVDGLADRVGQVQAIGGGQVPLVVATVWRLLTEGIGD